VAVAELDSLGCISHFMSKEHTTEQRALLAEAKVAALERALFRLAEAHFGDTQDLVDFKGEYNADVVETWPESCK
jgi:hypothetical protein